MATKQTKPTTPQSKQQPKQAKPSPSTTAMNAFSEIPTPAANAKAISAVQKKSGKVTGYQLSDGTLIDKPSAVNLARQGGITGVGIAKRSGTEYLKSLPDTTENNNLNALPIVQ
ncbi:MAG: DUF3892 domain-containing protein [Oscillospiraceae bacterium]|nr:DUF3892 domain-containing protein [Oscillospiraceae bacterium]